MGGVDLCSEGAPGGPSADGQRRRMAGCGAPRTSVSRSSPSIPQTSPVKRLRRYKKDLSLPLSLCLSSIHLYIFPFLSAPFCLFIFYFSSCTRQPCWPETHTYMHSLRNKPFPLWFKDLTSIFFHCCVLIPGRELHLCLLYLTWMIVFTPWRWRAFL